MNQLMIQQAVSTVRTLQGKIANSAGRGENVLDFAAIARDAVGGDMTTEPGKNAQDETNPLAALLLAALFTQPQAAIDTTAANDTSDNTTTNTITNTTTDTPIQVAPVEDLLAGQTPAVKSAPAAREELVTLLQSLGMGQDKAQDFVRQWSAVLQTAQQTAPQASPVGVGHVSRSPAVWTVAEQAIQSLMTTPIPTEIHKGMPSVAMGPVTTGIPMAATGPVTTGMPMAAGTPTTGTPTAAATTAPGAAAAQGTISQDMVDPIVQVRLLLGELLGEAVAPEGTHTERTAPQQDTKTVLTLRALLADLQAAQQTTAVASAPSPKGDARQDAAENDASTDVSPAAADATALNAMPATVTFPELRTADTTATQPVRRTLNEAFDTMVDTITTLRDSSKSEMEIHLKPDFLGKVVIKLTMEEGSLVARISASSSSVQDAFQTQAPQLTSALQQSGIKDVTVLVTHDMASGGALDQSTARQQHNPREQRRRSWAVQETTEKNDAARATAAYEQFWRNGTINYLA